MASEDSDQILLGCLPIHRFDDFCDFNQTIDIKMPVVRNHSHAPRELLKVALLCRSKRMGLEERYYRSYKILPPVHDELAQMLAVIIVPLGDIDATYTKEAP
jgi:hypothetical protein